MNSLIKIAFVASALLMSSCSHLKAEHHKEHKLSSQSLAVTMAYMEAMGKGDMKKMNALMADDMVWHNEGDKRLPWIGKWEGKQNVFKFLKLFSSNLKTKTWKTQLTTTKGKDVTLFGTMSAQLTKSGKTTKPFSWALHVVVEDGQVKLWHWLEDSYAVSRAYHGKK